MEAQAWEIIFKQLPVIVFLCIVNYVTYKHFIKEALKRETFFLAELAKRDKIIGDKDEEIRALNIRLVDLTSRCLEQGNRSLEQGNRNNEIVGGLKEMLNKFLLERK